MKRLFVTMLLSMGLLGLAATPADGVAPADYFISA